MPRYAAFLRAINVGGRQASKEALKAACERAGGTRVETLIASGNLLFEARSRDEGAVTRRIEAELLAELGFEVTTFVRGDAEMAVVASELAALATGDAGATLFAVFLAAPPAPDAWGRLQDAAAKAPDRFELRGRQLYWLRAGGYSDSPFAGPVLEKLLAAPATVRKSTTVLKMAAKLSLPR
ncbi:MAG: DUF1697 domain-containing protein [Deltaproteobacteria bacterium]|nr:DUF1697 domain-containing protein [Deltaproteobacteria bacterium]